MHNFYKTLAGALALVAGISVSANAAEKVNAFELNAVADEVVKVAAPAKAPAKANNATDYTWVNKGKASLTDDCFNSFFNVEVATMADIDIEEAEELPGFYRLVDPYKTYPYGRYSTTPCYLYLHTEEGADKVWFEEFNTGITLNTTYGQMLIGCLCDGYGGAYGTLADGNVTFGVKELYVGMTKYSGLNYANTNGKFNISLPGAADYSLSVTAPTCAKDNVMSFTVEAGADVATLKYYAIDGQFAATSANLAFVASNGHNLPGPGTYTIDFDDIEGQISLFVVALSAADEVVAGTVNYFYTIYENADEWTSLGYGKYTEDILLSFYDFGATGLSYEVEVQENNSKPGYYRIVNPYDSNSIFNVDQNSHDVDGHNHYIYIDASDPDKVSIEKSTIGVNLGDGDMYIVGMSTYLGEEATDADYGKLVDGVITFPAKSILAGFGSDLSLFYVNTNGKFALELPVETIVILWDNTLKQFAAPYVHYAVDGEGNEFADPIAMVKLEISAFDDEETADTGMELWGALVPATATHVKFSDANAEGTHTGVYEADEETVYNGVDVDSVEAVEAADAAAPVEYYNLQGIRVETPAAGSLVIRRQGSAAAKVRF